MGNGLSSIGAGVDDYPVAAVQSLLPGDIGGGRKKMAEELLVFRGRVSQRSEMLLRDHEQVGRGLRVQVGKGEGVVVLVDAGGGDCSGGDFAEDAVGAHGLHDTTALRKLCAAGQESVHAKYAKGARFRKGFLRSIYSFRVAQLVYCFGKYFGAASGAQGS